MSSNLVILGLSASFQEFMHV